jgi:predicted lysophospholipase L1 biosynthesis ABC-type transport system permease subunit
MPLSRKLVASLISNVLVWAITYIIIRTGFSETAAVSSVIASVAGVLSGFISGWLVKEFPGLISASKPLK